MTWGMEYGRGCCKKQIETEEKEKEEKRGGFRCKKCSSISDGCNPELVAGAEFAGIFEMPIIKKPKKMIIPDNLVPFSKMKKADKKNLQYVNMKMIENFAICW